MRQVKKWLNFVHSTSSAVPYYYYYVCLPLLLLSLAEVSCSIVNGGGDFVRDLEISENVPIGTRVGFIGDGFPGGENGPPYLIIPVGQGVSVDTDLDIDEKTGEIRTKAALDRETRSNYYFVAIPMNGQNIQVTVKVMDENDNAPSFPVSLMMIEFPENSPRDAKRTLYPAKDSDLGMYNTQKYNLIGGNVNNAFKLSYHREKDGVLYLDLQVNGILDRETLPSYSLQVEAIDGGAPPLRGVMTVNVSIQDANDNQPIFNQTRYFATVPENATIGTSVIRVFATDVDEGDNGVVEYFINRRQSDKENYFSIAPRTGIITVNRLLDFESKESHELVVVAKDLGTQPLETVAFVFVRVTDVNDNQPTINVIFLSEDATPKVSEDAKVGQFVARISVNDPDSKTEYSNVNVTVEGGDGHFGLTTRDSVTYLVVVGMPMDRESKAIYQLNITATDTGTPPLHASKSIHLTVTDVNDNAPEFSGGWEYRASVSETSEQGTFVLQVTATDKDEGANSEISYYISEESSTSPSWFQIDSKSGVISTRARIECDVDAAPRIVVVAKDHGYPRALSSSATVFIAIHDTNDNEPVFTRPYYNLTIPEDQPVGSCILRVLATDLDCGVNAFVNYSLQDFFSSGVDDRRPSTLPFYLKKTPADGENGGGHICISAPLDYEMKKWYEFSVIAVDRGGLSAVSVIYVKVLDVNDNAPVFHPQDYKVSLSSSVDRDNNDLPIAMVKATDSDSEKYGSVRYYIQSGNDEDAFRMQSNTGELFAVRPKVLLDQRRNGGRQYVLNISAVDGEGIASSSQATVVIRISSEDPEDGALHFTRARYTFAVPEDAPVNYPIGSVTLSNIAREEDGSDDSLVRYSIASSSEENEEEGGKSYFSIDAASGMIKVARPLDREQMHSVLLNVQAITQRSVFPSFAQVIITIEDQNDNSPEFERSLVRLSVPENTPVGSTLYVARANDEDAAINGAVRYYLLNGGGAAETISTISQQRNPTIPSDHQLFFVHAKEGSVTLANSLDYESSQRSTLLIAAVDGGRPPRQSNLTLLIEVQDANDNAPIFERSNYHVAISESLPAGSEVLQVTATDLDSGNNAKITYKIVDDSREEEGDLSSLSYFGVRGTTGWLYLKKQLDRETIADLQLRILATDNGISRNTATTTVSIRVIDANDNAPLFLLTEGYTFFVEENKMAGTRVGLVQAVDRDEGVNAVIKYSLLPANSSFHVNQFTGEITLRESLDRETRSSYDLIVEAKDEGSPSKSSRTSIRVLVTDVNDNPPSILDPQADTITVREQQPPGTEVVKIKAVDPDNGYNGTLSYSIQKGRDVDGYGVFTIDPVSGVLKTRLALDDEERSMYRVAVVAADNGHPPKQTVRVFRIEVLDLNDNRPTFTSSSLLFKVREDVLVGHIVGGVVDSDNMMNNVNSMWGQIMYTLISAVPAGSEKVFEIDKRTGTLVIAEQLDRELCDEYRLEIKAWGDTGMNSQSSTVLVKLQVLDVNDNAPSWNSDLITVTVPENIPVGSIVWNLTASDRDLGVNSEIHYELLKQTPPFAKDADLAFSVDSLTGALLVTSELDFEQTKEYILVIQATDKAVNVTDRLHSTVTVRVIVTDVNDNKPVIIAPLATTVYIGKSISKESDHVCKVIAVDKDSGENGRVTYSLSTPMGASGHRVNCFEINRETGVVTFVKSSVKQQYCGNVESYILNVTATDQGFPNSLSSTISLNLLFRVMPENKVAFPRSVYYANVSEDAAIGSIIITISAVGGGGINDRHYSGELDGVYYEIAPRSDANYDQFTVDRRTGVVTLRKSLDRETKDSHVLYVYAIDPKTKHSDMAIVMIRVLDVNDNPPVFKPGSCYPLHVPENTANEFSPIHTVTAMDKDLGLNAKLSYSIVEGNVGNKFSIHPQTGELFASSLDRESQSRYHLTVAAEDESSNVVGLPLMSYCNITVYVEDENDNDPQFERSQYSTSILEDSTVGITVLSVKATDSDAGANAQIVYALRGEMSSVFHINNKTGAIILAKELDREKTSVYEFQAIAMDSGRHKCRSVTAYIRITVDDVNDNKPQFAAFPFVVDVSPHAHIGTELTKVVAIDKDEGINADVAYKFSPNDEYSGNNKFRINPITGSISIMSSLSFDAGRVFYLNIVAVDKGNPPLSSAGLVEVRVCDENCISHRHPVLRFQNDSYDVWISETSSIDDYVLQVLALRSDGRHQKVLYSINKEGNDEGEEAFAINSQTGVIRVAKPSALDYETIPVHRIGLIAQTENTTTATGTTHPLFAFAELRVHLTDENDNPPLFTQTQYFDVVLEGNPKGTFVTEILAIDADEGTNGKLSYHIVDGNHDNAFVIDPPGSGIIRTNIVLDAEIRDTYKITIIATDEGVPQQMTGTSSIRINVIDINDNQPSFPPHNSVSISEGTEAGSVIATVTANDVDSFPPLVYALDELITNGSEESSSSSSPFAIDRYTGRVTLRKSLDFELVREYSLQIVATDAVHVTKTTLTVMITDENDNFPTFSQLFYKFPLPLPPSTVAVENAKKNREMSYQQQSPKFQVTATDADSAENGLIRYSIATDTSIAGFGIDKETGVIFANRSAISAEYAQKEYIDARVAATDCGYLPLSSEVYVRFKTNSDSLSDFTFTHSEYRVVVKENAPKGKILSRLGGHNGPTNGVFSITSGNEEKRFDILNPTGDLVLVDTLDRETTDVYSLLVTFGQNVSNTIVNVIVEDSNDNAPRFQNFSENVITIALSEDVPLNQTVTRVFASDVDLPPNSDIFYEILSGNDFEHFALDANTGALTINKPLDYDNDKGGYPQQYSLVIRAVDGGDYPLSSDVMKLQITVKDENDNSPVFPITGEYLEFVGENEPVGTSVFTAHATDADKGIYGVLNYSLGSSSSSVYPESDNSWRLFKIDSASGLVTTNAVFDYEVRSRYGFTLLSCDTGGRCAKVKVTVEVESKDEYHPQFSEPVFRFVYPVEGVVGQVIGHVSATDRDKGPDGRVVYQLSGQNPYFKINRTTGALMIKKRLEGGGQDVNLVVTASSGRQRSLTNVTVVEITFDPLNTLGTNLASNRATNKNEAAVISSSSSSSSANWIFIIFFILLLIVICSGMLAFFIHIKNQRRRNCTNKGGSFAATGGGARVDYVDAAGTFDTIPIRRPNVILSATSQYGGGGGGPPKYDEIPTYRGGNNGGNSSTNSGVGPATVSELSPSEQSGSSGRGSAEDDVDEEIRMINEEQSRHQQRLHSSNGNGDNLSDVSVQNTQQYLARLGIVSSHVDTFPAANNTNTNGNSSNVGKLMKQNPESALHAASLVDEESGGGEDIAHIIYSKLNDVGGHVAEGGGLIKRKAAGRRGCIEENGIMMEGYGIVTAVPTTTTATSTQQQQPSMSGSLSSIVHSEEELTGSYNWDYLADWGPQYQPLAHVFSEIARIREGDAASVKSATSGASSNKSRCAPPPIITSLPPSVIPAAPVLSNRQLQLQQHSTPYHHHHQMIPPSLTRSPISRDIVGDFSTSTAMSPSFSPSLSPLAAKSPSTSPPPLHLQHQVAGGVSTAAASGHRVRQRHHHHHNAASSSSSHIRI